MEFIEKGDAKLNAAINKHWRDVAEYERYVTPLVVRLEAVEWRSVLALHSARWHKEAIASIRTRTLMTHYCSLALSHKELINDIQKRKSSEHGWLGSYYNAHTGTYRRIQRYSLIYIHNTGTYPIRFCPLEGPPVSWGFWFRISDFDNANWIPEAHAWHSYKSQRERMAQVLEKIDNEESNMLNPRQYLADRLRAASQRLGGYLTHNYMSAQYGVFTKETYQLNTDLDKAIDSSSKPSYSGALSPFALGELEAKWENFQLCLRKFHEAEEAALASTPAQLTSPAKGTPAADVRRYFPKAATIHGTTATNANALHQLAVWLLHWAERPNGKRYSIADQLRKQLASHPNAGKFLKACRRLHKALTPLAATELEAKALLGKEHTPHSLDKLQATLKWWVGWIREQQMALDDPAGAYLATLRRVPVIEEWQNGIPHYSLPTYLGIYNKFEAEIAPLRQAFETVLPDLSTKKKRALHHELNKLLAIDLAGIKRRQEQFDRGEYRLEFLPTDYPALRFEVAGEPDEFKWQRVSPIFWSGLSMLLKYKQRAARFACETLDGMPTERPGVGTDTVDDYYKNLGMPAPIKQLHDVMQADRLTRAQIELVENQAKVAKQSLTELPLLTPADVRTLYLKLLEHPALVSELNGYQKSELRAYAEGERLAATRLAVKIMDENPQYDYPAAYRNGREVEYWQAKISGYANSERVLHLLAAPASNRAIHLDAPLLPPVNPAAAPALPIDVNLADRYPWAEIEALAEKIGLRKGGRFTTPGNKIAAAGAGFIDALLDAGILPTTSTRAVLYADFSQYYSQPIKAERTKPTRTAWHKKAREALSIFEWKPTKKQA
jgi:hypothetical protein